MLTALPAPKLSESSGSLAEECEPAPLDRERYGMLHSFPLPADLRDVSPIADTARQWRQILQLFRYQVYAVTFSLNAATTPHHAGR